MPEMISTKFDGYASPEQIRFALEVIGNTKCGPMYPGTGWYAKAQVWLRAAAEAADLEGPRRAVAEVAQKLVDDSGFSVGEAVEKALANYELKQI